MKLTNKQKTIIRKSLKLNEDFFDDLSDNELIDEPVDDSFGEPIDNTDYTYHFQFIIFMDPFIKPSFSDDCEYVFDDPKYENKLTIEHSFLSIKKALEYILQATPIVTGYSEPKFCSSTKSIIKAFPFMNNKKSDDYKPILGDDYYIMLETSINLSSRKNVNNLTKFFYSLWRLQQIHNKVVTIMKSDPYRRHRTSLDKDIGIRVYKNNPYKYSKRADLMPSNTKLDKFALDIINFLNSKDETDK